MDCRRRDWTFPCRCGCEGGVEEEGGMETEVDQVLPANYDIADVTRSILAEKPRVTRFEVDWS